MNDPAFPGAVVADQSFNGVTEWVYGATPWFEAGLYLPLYGHDKHPGWTVDGFKLLLSKDFNWPPGGRPAWMRG